MSSGKPTGENAVSSSILPPCRVCYGKASGFHYGLNTCEACKAFFRRSQKKYHLYKCNRASNCEIAFEKRGLCTYCRYQKCINLGMGKHAIKTGRYTHEKKANDIKEVRGLQQWSPDYHSLQQTDEDEQLIKQDQLLNQLDLQLQNSDQQLKQHKKAQQLNQVDLQQLDQLKQVQQLNYLDLQQQNKGQRQKQHKKAQHLNQRQEIGQQLKQQKQTHQLNDWDLQQQDFSQQLQQLSQLDLRQHLDQQLQKKQKQLNGLDMQQQGQQLNQAQQWNKLDLRKQDLDLNQQLILQDQELQMKEEFKDTQQIKEQDIWKEERQMLNKRKLDVEDYEQMKPLIPLQGCVSEEQLLLCNQHVKQEKLCSPQIKEEKLCSPQIREAKLLSLQIREGKLCSQQKNDEKRSQELMPQLQNVSNEKLKPGPSGYLQNNVSSLKDCDERHVEQWTSRNPLAGISGNADPVTYSSSIADPDSDISFTDSPSQSAEQTAYDKNKISYYEEIIQKIIKVYKGVSPHSDEFYDRVWPEKVKDYLEKAELRSKVFGTLRTMSLKEYFVFYQETGIDVDGRYDLVKKVYVPFIEDCIRRCINFAKAIPGFSQISMADQIALIKTSRHSSFMVSSHKSFNIQHRLYMSADGEIICWNDMIKVNDPEYLECIFLLQTKFSQLQLTPEETCILAAFVVVFPDDSDVKDIPQIEEIQELLLHCLLYLFDKHHPGNKMRLSKVVDCLILMRTLRDLQMKDEDRVAQDWLGIVDMPLLFHEMWSFR